MMATEPHLDSQAESSPEKGRGPASLRALPVFLLLLGNTAFWALPFLAVAGLKLVPVAKWRRTCTTVLKTLARGWIAVTLGVLRLNRHLRWDIRLPPDLRPDDWYLLVANHRAWSDILVLLRALHGRISFPVFFAKKELFWLPFVGTAMWALDFPFMERHTPEEIALNPGLRDHDLAAARQSCRRHRHAPVTVVNFVEGTRFTPAKHAARHSTFRHLLPPRAGGAALTLAAMEGKIDRLVDVTIAYPGGRKNFWDFLGGRTGLVRVVVRTRPVPAEFLAGDYRRDPDFRRRFRDWLGDLWQEKDDLLSELGTRPPSPRSARSPEKVA